MSIFKITMFELVGECVLISGPGGDTPPFRYNALHAGRDVAKELGIDTDIDVIRADLFKLEIDDQNPNKPAPKQAREACEKMLAAKSGKSLTLPELPSEAIVYKDLGGIHVIGLWVYVNNVPLYKDASHMTGYLSRAFGSVQMRVVPK